MRAVLASAAAIVLLLGAGPVRAACVTGACNDPGAVDIARALISAACDCAGAKSHGKYVQCAKQVIRGAVKSGTLPKTCRGGVLKCEAGSNCGMAEKTAVCCIANPKTGKVKAKLTKRSGGCPGERCSGAMSLAEACTTTAACRSARTQIRAFSSIQNVLTGSCALPSCHSALSLQGGLVLDSEDISYDNLVNHPAVLADANGMLRVKPGDPANSFLIRKLHGQGPGDSMPQGAPPLSEPVIQMISDWIQRGAKTTKEECAGNDPTICAPDNQPVGDYHWVPEQPLDPPAASEGIQLYVPQRPVDPGKEWETCYAFKPDWTALGAAMGYQNGALPWISKQIYRMHQGSHHLLLYGYFGQHSDQFNWLPPDDKTPYPHTGFFDCFAATCLNPSDCPSDIGQKLPVGGTQVAGTHYEIDYPTGVGIPTLTPDSVMIANLHFTNPFQPPQPIYGEAWLNLYFNPPDKTVAILDGIFAINAGLYIPPYQTRTISSIWQPRNLLTRAATDAAVFQLFGHFHKRGVDYKIDVLRDANCSGDASRACGTDAECGAGQTCVKGPNAQDTTIYHTTQWDHAPVTNYPPPYLRVKKTEGLRWTCTHTNGIQGDPLHPPRQCAAFGCDATINDQGQVQGDDCAWNDTTHQCFFRGTPPGCDFGQDGVNGTCHGSPTKSCAASPTCNGQVCAECHIFAEGEGMPLIFGELANDDMCNMFGYFVDEADLARLPPQ